MIIYQSIRFTQRYRSGHNEAVLKTVWVHAHVGSNPTLSANRIFNFVTIMQKYSSGDEAPLLRA